MYHCSATSFNKIFPETPDAAKVVFGTMSPLALSHGKSIFENFLTAFTDYVKPYVEAETKAAQVSDEKAAEYKAEYDRLIAGTPKN